MALNHPTEEVNNIAGSAGGVSVSSPESGPTGPGEIGADQRAVTNRALLLGFLLSGGLAVLNTWATFVKSVHFLGGIHMPFASVFVLMFLILGLNLPLRKLHQVAPATRRWLPCLTAVELLTIYAMTIFGALVSTPGTDNFFITIGSGLFYFTTRENGWAELFYKHVPSWFAPGWDGQTFQKEVIDGVYLGGKSFAQIPWHAWTVMLVAWSIFWLLIYSTLFFTSLILRKQWIKNEALAFPLVQLPLQMVDTTGGTNPPGKEFWTNGMMWAGFSVAAFFILIRGLYTYDPSWPYVPLSVTFNFTERPFDVLGFNSAQLFFGGMGVAYLLTREVSFSFWFFFLFFKLQLVLAETSGFSVAGLPKDSYMGRPTFITFQSVGGWLALAALLIWSARSHIKALVLEAVGKNQSEPDEPFAPRFIIFGWLASVVALLAWSQFAGLNIIIAVIFFGIYFLASLVLARIVVEGGFLFPQMTFSTVEVMSTALLGSTVIGAANLTKLTFLQPTLMGDMRTNVLPAFLHTLKIADALQVDKKGTNRLMKGVVAALVLTMVVSTITSVYVLYSYGGLAGYSWFTTVGPQSFWSGTATFINRESPVSAANISFMGVGAVSVLLLTLFRSRFVWFSFHPLGYIMASGYPIAQLWFSFFLGWLIKTLVLKYGGSDAVVKTRPLMIGFIFGNLVAMVFWLIVAFFTGKYISFWSA